MGKEKFTRIKTIGDGNCAFNAFALGLKDLLQVREELNPDVQNAFLKAFNAEYPQNSQIEWQTFRAYILSLPEEDLQKILAPVLRNMAIDYYDVLQQAEENSIKFAWGLRDLMLENSNLLTDEIKYELREAFNSFSTMTKKHSWEEFAEFITDSSFCELRLIYNPQNSSYESAIKQGQEIALIKRDAPPQTTFEIAYFHKTHNKIIYFPLDESEHSALLKKLDGANFNGKILNKGYTEIYNAIYEIVRNQDGQVQITPNLDKVESQLTGVIQELQKKPAAKTLALQTAAFSKAESKPFIEYIADSQTAAIKAAFSNALQYAFDQAEFDEQYVDFYNTPGVEEFFAKQINLLKQEWKIEAQTAQAARNPSNELTLTQKFLWIIPWHANYHINKIAREKLNTNQSYYSKKKNSLQLAEDQVCKAWKTSLRQNYNTKMRKNAQWVGTSELVALARCFKLNLSIIEPSLGMNLKNVDDQKNSEGKKSSTITILNTTRHFIYCRSESMTVSLKQPLLVTHSINNSPANGQIQTATSNAPTSPKLANTSQINHSSSKIRSWMYDVVAELANETLKQSPEYYNYPAPIPPIETNKLQN